MIEIIQTGTDMRLVDMGRSGKRHLGIPISGAMDMESALHAHSLIGQDHHNAIVEVLGPGAALKFKTKAVISITGAIADIHIDDKLIKTPVQVELNENQQLKIQSIHVGARLYLAIKGLLADRLMDSCCTLLPYFDNRLKKGQILATASFLTSPSYSSFSPSLELSSSILTVYRGPEYNLLNTEQQDQLNSAFLVSKDISTMGYRLQGIPITAGYPTQIVSSAVLPGTVQLLPNGQLVILMRDCQTTGGYPRVLQLAEKSISLLAQKQRGDTILFQLI